MQVSSPGDATPPDRGRWLQVSLLSAAFLVLAAVSLASLYWLNRARQDAGWVTHTLEVENDISLALLQIRRAESAERGYLLTQQQEFLTEFDEAATDTLPKLQALLRQTRDNARQQAALQEIVTLAQARLDQFRRVLELGKNRKLNEAAELVRINAGRTTMNRIRDLAMEMQGEEQRLFRERAAAAERSQSLAAAVTTSGAALVVILATISIVLLRRSAKARDVAEAKLLDTNLNLESIVADRTADLREANQEIQRFAYIVSHDLRSPLVNIMGFTSELEDLRQEIFRRIEVLGRHPNAAPSPQTADSDAPLQLAEGDQKLSDDFNEALGFIKSSIAKMDRLIGAILALNREGRREFRPVRIDTRELIEGLVGTMAHQASEAEAQIRVEPLPHIISDRLALEQIFSNLIDNALKYLRPGVPGDIAIRGREKLGFAIFEIEDNGRGIDPKDHQRIFDLFRRAGPQDRPGQGIGLAHVRALVRRLGGTMSVSSRLGGGATFTITLPTKWLAPSQDASA